MPLKAEVINRLQPKKSCDGLLYTPLTEPCTYRSTRCYNMEYKGEHDAAVAFVGTVLVDETIDILKIDTGPALDGYAFFLDYGMKPGALDLEKEAILRYYRDSGPYDFDLQTLTLRQRLYVFNGENQSPPSPDSLIRDAMNPAIHTWKVSHA